MKQVLLLTISIFLTSTVFAVHPKVGNSKAEVSAESNSAFAGLTFEELMTMKPREIKQKTGKKLKFKERMALKIAKIQYKKAKKRGKQASMGTDQLSLAAFIFSGVGLLLFFVPFVVGIFSLIGLILGIVALTSPERYQNKKGKGLAVAAVVISGIVIIIPVLIIAILFSGF